MPTPFDSIPAIKYDRSGRSSGVALVTYESTAEAKRALNEYNGKLCKGVSYCREVKRDTPDSFPLDL